MPSTSLPSLSPRATPFMGETPRGHPRRSATPRLPPASATQNGYHMTMPDPMNGQMYPTPNCQNRPTNPRFGLMVNKYQNEHPQCVFEDLSPRRSFYVIHPDWTSEGNSTRFMEMGRQRQIAQLADQRPYHFYHPVNADVERLLALRRKREMERDGTYMAMHQRYAGLTPAQRGEPACMQPAWNLPPENIFYRRLAMAPHKVNPRYVPFTY